MIDPQTFANMILAANDPKKYKAIHLMACNAAAGGEHSFAAQFQKIMGKPVQAYEGIVTAKRGPDALLAKYASYMEKSHDIQVAVAGMQAEYGGLINDVYNVNPHAWYRNPMKWMKFEYKPVIFA
ncbi:hypothetical protein D9M71_675180 [compost metagenome]